MVVIQADRGGKVPQDGVTWAAEFTLLTILGARGSQAAKAAP